MLYKYEHISFSYECVIKFKQIYLNLQIFEYYLPVNTNIKIYTKLMLKISKKFTDHTKNLLTFITGLFKIPSYLKYYFDCK